MAAVYEILETLPTRERDDIVLDGIYLPSSTSTIRLAVGSVVLVFPEADVVDVFQASTGVGGAVPVKVKLVASARLLAIEDVPPWFGRLPFAFSTRKHSPEVHRPPQFQEIQRAFLLQRGLLSDDPDHR